MLNVNEKKFRHRCRKLLNWKKDLKKLPQNLQRSEDMDSMKEFKIKGKYIMHLTGVPAKENRDNGS